VRQSARSCEVLWLSTMNDYYNQLPKAYTIGWLTDDWWILIDSARTDHVRWLCAVMCVSFDPWNVSKCGVLTVTYMYSAVLQRSGLRSPCPPKSRLEIGIKSPCLLPPLFLTPHCFPTPLPYHLDALFFTFFLSFFFPFLFFGLLSTAFLLFQ